MNFIEKREIERFDLELPAVLSMRDEDGNRRTAEYMISNICSGGAFFKTENPLSLGTEVKMDMILPLESFAETEGKRPQLDISGSVIRIEENGMAVCFDKKYRIKPS